MKNTWVQPEATLRRMLFLAGQSDIAELDNAPTWHSLFTDDPRDVGLMPLNNGMWLACCVTQGASWSLVACVPTGAFDGRCSVSRPTFFADLFPHHWITASRAASKAYDPAKAPRMRPEDVPHRRGFPCLGLMTAGHEVLLCLAHDVQDGKLVSVIQSPDAAPRPVEEIGAKRWYSIHHNTLGAARLFWSGRTILNNSRFAFMLMGLHQARLRKRGVDWADDEITETQIQGVRSTLNY